MKTIIRGGRVLTASSELNADVLFENGKITQIGTDIDIQDANIIDASGKFVFPGGVDQHVHYSFEFKGEKVRGFETSNAAALGGTTTVIEFVNQKKGMGLVETINEYDKNEVRENAMVDYAFHAIITDTSVNVFDEIKKLPEHGISTVKLFMAYKGLFFHMDDDSIIQALKAGKEAGVTIMVHAENADLIDILQKECIQKGQYQPIYHAESRPPLAETEATERAINLAKAMDAPLYIVHVTTKGAVDAIKRAKDEGYRINGETCTHYLLLDKSNLGKPDFEGAKYVCSPALREQADRDYLWKAVKKGWLNAISSDHCGFDWANQKHMGIKDFRDIPNGAPGVENRIPMIWTYGVEEGLISKVDFVNLTSTTPAKVNGLYGQKGNIEVGFDADIVIYDPMVESNVSVKNSLQGVDFNSYEGFKQKGKVEKVFLRGELIVDNGNYIGKKKQGKFLMSKPFGSTYETN